MGSVGVSLGPANLLLLLSSASLSIAQALTHPDAPQAGWGYTGCYTDAVGSRTLNGATFAGGSMSNTACVQFCATKGFYYAGTEYSQECFCGNSLMNGGHAAAEGDCNMACSGNAAEACGGPNRLTLYNTTIPPGPTGPFVNPGVNGYRSLGCYSDNVGARTLPIGMPTTGGAGALTVALCTSACDAGNYLYAGVEYSQECFCANDIANGGSPQADSDCNMVCNGNATEFCGGPNRLNLYTKRQAPSGWQAIGCYTDSVAARTLPAGVGVAGGMTTEGCLAACRSAGNYIYAGTEYGGECYCGNSFQNGGGPAPDGSAGCNMACNGNAQETCGGPNRLNMYQFGDGTTPTGTTSTPTPTPTTPVPTDIPTNWHYQGCWIDNANGRIMINQRPDDTALTPASCIAKCTALGYGAAGMEYGVQCFCDNFLRNGAVKTSDSDCNMGCGGDATQKCGAGNRLTIFSNSTDPIVANPVPSTQTGNLTGSWQYLGCYHDNQGARALPYQIILSNNNTANNCIKQCSDFGYEIGGMEYGDECYCGDWSDILAAGSTPAPESSCTFPCTGNITSFCGGSGVLSLYKWAGPALTAWNYASGNAAGAYEFLIGGVVVPLVTQAARNGKVTFMEKSGTGAPNTTGAYELDLAQINNFTGAWRPMHVKSDIFCSASITLPDKVGRQLNVGGWALGATYGVRLYWPDGSPGVWGTNDWQENEDELSLQNGRWYPTAMVMANGSILVVGGEEGSNGKAVPTLEIMPKVGPVVFCDWLNRTDPNNLYPFMFVLPSGGIFVQYYNEALILDEVTMQVKKQLPNAPGAVNNFLAGRTYPYEGTAVVMPQHAPYTDPLTVMVCGGSTPFQGFALDSCVSIAPDAPTPEWVLERMPSKRVMTCMTALPDGTYLIVNGAHQGVAGFGLATDPNMNAVLYDPSLPLNHRFTVMANTTVARLYHSEAILLDDGRVLVSGSDPQDVRFPEEYRVEVFVPPYLMGNPTRPSVNITSANSDWAYGGSYSFTFSSTSGISKVSVMGVGGSTHGNSMGQRTLFPAFSCTASSCTVTAPPNAHICPPGWYQVFALDGAGVPSIAKWVRIGGDPADLGAWPANLPDFTIPGSG